MRSPLASCHYAASRNHSPNKHGGKLPPTSENQRPTLPRSTSTPPAQPEQLTTTVTFNVSGGVCLAPFARYLFFMDPGSQSCCRSRGFTLVEVLTVVLIMAILAAVIVPQFFDTTVEAKLSATQHNLRVLRSQIALYKQHHDGKLPSATWLVRQRHFGR